MVQSASETWAATNVTVTPCALHDLILIFFLYPIYHTNPLEPIDRNLIEPTPITITHIPSVHRNYGEVIYRLMIPTGYIGPRVYTADMMTHYSTLPTVFYFSKRAPLYISYSSLLFKPPCIPSYFSSFRIELRTGPLLIPIVSLRVLLCSNHLLTLINSSAIVFDTILKKYAKSQRRIIPINSSSLRSEPSLTVSNDSYDRDSDFEDIDMVDVDVISDSGFSV